jgi:hypothetical protein
MSTSAARHPADLVGLFAYASFAIMVGGWVAFAVVRQRPPDRRRWDLVAAFPADVEPGAPAQPG